MAKKALGKGLDALFFVQDGEEKEQQPGKEERTPALPRELAAQVRQIAIEKIDPNPHQPRKRFNPETLEELTTSIREKGMIQPILVEQAGERFILVAGERRYRASKMAGLTEVPALVRSFSENERIEIALIENIQRDDLSPIEEAAAYAGLMEKSGYSQEEVAQKVGKKRSTIANSLRLLKLPEEMREALQTGTLTPGHARAVLSVNDEKQKRQLYSKIIHQGLSVREAEKEAGRLNEAKPETTAPENKPARQDPEIMRMEQELLDKFGTKVSIRGSLENGKIEISYFSMDDLDRIYEIIFSQKK